MTTTTDRLDGQTGPDAHTTGAVEAPDSPADQRAVAAQPRRVGGDPGLLRSDQRPPGVQEMRVAAEQSPHLAKRPARPVDLAPGGAPNSLDGHAASDTQVAVAVEGPDGGDHVPADIQSTGVAAPTPPAPATRRTATTAASPVRADPDGRPAAKLDSAPKDVSPLADPVLQLAADMLDDFERVRIANENRLRQLTRGETDADGIRRGLGIPADHPMIAATAKLVEAGAALEHDAELNLRRMLRTHPLGPWVKRTIGIGEKQGARLLASIGDPYWNTLHDRPRTVSELWAYCGYHVIRTGHGATDAHCRGAGSDPTSARHEGPATQVGFAGGTQLPAGHVALVAQASDASGGQSGSHLDQVVRDAHMISAGVAATRRRGARANWSATAKMRAYLCAESCMKNRSSPYRDLYEAGREKYAEVVHAVECVRCGPAGKPAPVGSPLSDGHKHARALRLVAKAILKDLWREAGRLHGADTSPPTTIAQAAPKGDPSSGAIPNTREAAQCCAAPIASPPSPGAGPSDSDEP